jgi:hypothetical protein
MIYKLSAVSRLVACVNNKSPDMELNFSGFGKEIRHSKDENKVYTKEI